MDFEKQLKFCQNTSLWLPVLFENAGVQGEEICKVSGGSSCYNVTSVGEGICKAGGGSSCYNVTSFGEGVCKANNGSSCYNVQSLTDGLCKAAGSLPPQYCLIALTESYRVSNGVYYCVITFHI
jgi:uncharacterized membrane protein